MSWQASAWAIELSELDDSSMKFVLVCLANYAGEDGRNAFPSIATLADHTCLSESTVRRKLQELETRGIITRGNQAIAAAHIDRADRLPVVYDLPLSRGVTMTPRDDDGVSKEGVRGVKSGPTGCQALTPNPLLILPKQERVKTHEEVFRERFGVSPSEASEIRKAAKRV